MPETGSATRPAASSLLSTVLRVLLLPCLQLGARGSRLGAVCAHPQAACPPPAARRKLPSVGCRLRVKHFMSVSSFTLYQYSMKLYKIILRISQMRSWDSEWLRNWPGDTEPLSGRFASPPSAVLLETDPPMTAGFSWFPSQAKEKFRDSEVSGKRKVSVLL